MCQKLPAYWRGTLPLRLSVNAERTLRLYDSPHKMEGRESGFLSIFLSSRRHNTSCEGELSLKSAAVWVAALLVASLFDSSCIYRWEPLTAGLGGERGG